MSEKNAVKKSSSDCVVPLIRVRLTQSARILINQRRMVAVELDEATAGEVLIECDLDFEKICGVQVEDSLVHVSSNGAAEIFIVNTSGFTCAVHKGEIVGRATEVEVEKADKNHGVRILGVRDETYGEDDEGEECEHKRKLES